MSGFGPSDRSDAMHELLNRYVSGETSPEENRLVEEYASADRMIEQELNELRRARSFVRLAVGAEPVPESLRESVRRATVDAESARTIRMQQPSRTRAFRWYYAAAAVLLILIGGWFVLSRIGGEGVPDSGGSIVESVPPVDRAREILRIGMTDHLKCAVTYYKGDVPEYSLEKMRAGLGAEFEELIPVVREKIEEGKLVVAHRCSFGGRNYVHMIVKGDDRMISIAITRRGRDETLEGVPGAVATDSNVPVYRAAMDGFEVAGFEAGRFFVFVASNLPAETNLRIASDVARPVSDVLGRVVG